MKAIRPRSTGTTRGRTTPRAAAVAAIAAIALALSACGTTDVSEAGQTEDAVASKSCADDKTTTSTDPVNMTDSLGRTVKLDAPAKRVAVLEWQQTEDLLSLCVTPVGAASTKDYGTYVSAEKLPDSVKDVGERGEPDLDTLYGTNPDLIVVEAYSKNDELLKKLEKRKVPVLVTKGADANGQLANMKKIFSMIGQATGRTERADQVLAEYDKHLDAAKEKVANVDLKTKKFVFLDGWVEGGNVVIRPYGTGALFTELGEELGEELGMEGAWTDKINKSYGSGGVDPQYGLAQTDIEGLTAVGDANLFFADDGTKSSYTKELETSKIWKNLPAVKEGRAYRFPAGVWGAGGPRSNEQAIDAFVDVLTGATTASASASAN